MTSVSFRTGSQRLATLLLLLLQAQFIFAGTHHSTQKSFPRRKSGMLQYFDFGFDIKNYSADVVRRGGNTYGAADRPQYSGNSMALKGVCISWNGSILGSFIDTDQGFRVGDLVGVRLDQGPVKQDSYFRETQTNGTVKEEKWSSTKYYGRVDFDLGIQAAYRFKNNLDVGLRLFYELGQTFGTNKLYDHTHKIIGSWVEYNRWVGQVEYGGVWNLSSKVYPTKKFKASLRWFTSDNRKFFLGINYERLHSESVQEERFITYDGQFYDPYRTTRIITQQNVQFVGGIMF